MTSRQDRNAERSPGSADGAPAVARVESLLAEQYGLFLKLEQLSGRQSGLIKQDLTDELLEVLAERQVLVDQIMNVSAQLDPWRGNWSEFINSLDGQVRQRVRERVDAVSGVAQKVAERDEADRLLLEQRKGAIAAELGQVDRGRSAMSAYSAGGPRAESGPRFQDREA